MSLREPRPQSQGRTTAKGGWATSPQTETAVAIFRTLFVIGAVVALWVERRVFNFANPAYVVSVLAGVYNVALVIVLRLRRPRRPFSDQLREFTLTLDVVFVTLWVGFGGDVGRTFVPLYYPLMVIAGLWFGMIGAAVTAFAASAFAIFVLLVAVPRIPGAGAIPTAALLQRIPFLFLVALAVGYIANAQKRELEQIEDARVKLAELQEHQRLMHEYYELVTPAILPPVGLDVGVGFRPALRTGAGDYYDLLPLEDGRYGLCVADVAGKYEAGALHVPVVKYALRAAASLETRPARIMERVNELVFNELQPDRFATMFYAQIDYWGGEVRYVNAGHDPALLLRGDGAVEMLETGGLVLGVLHQARYDDDLVRMGPDDALVLYTDGAVEAVNASREEFGRERLIAAAQAAVERFASADEAAKHILHEVTEFARLDVAQSTDDESRRDDITVIVARLAPRPVLGKPVTPQRRAGGRTARPPREAAD
jgi:serine phosphatase RsbU (regulator of sigma subunit)